MYVHNYNNMNLVHANQKGCQLWLGDMRAASDIDLLRSKNIRFAAALDVAYPPQSGITQRKIEAYDHPNYDISQHFDSAFTFLKQCLNKGNVLVHCAAGVSRSATIVVMYLMRLYKWSLDKTLTYVKEKRPVVYPNPGFFGKLLKLQGAILKAKYELKREEKAVMDFLQQTGTKNGRSSFQSTAKMSQKTSQTNNSWRKSNHSTSKQNPVKLEKSVKNWGIGTVPLELAIKSPLQIKHTRHASIIKK